MAKLLARSLQLVPMMDGFHGLLEAHRNDEADDDGGDVDEEVFPGVGGFVGRVDVEHRSSLSQDVRMESGIWGFSRTSDAVDVCLDALLGDVVGCGHGCGVLRVGLEFVQGSVG